MARETLVDIKFDLDKGHVRLYDKELGIRSIDLGAPASMIRDQYRLLQAFRDDGRVPHPELLWEIRLYEFILQADDPNKTAMEYLEKRHEMSEQLETMCPKRAVAKALGWEIG